MSDEMLSIDHQHTEQSSMLGDLIHLIDLGKTMTRSLHGHTVGIRHLGRMVGVTIYFNSVMYVATRSKQDWIQMLSSSSMSDVLEIMAGSR